MIEAILDDRVEVLTATNNPPFNTALDYAVENAKKAKAVESWKALDATGKAKHNNSIEEFFRASGVADLRSPELARAKNLFILRKEIAAYVGQSSQFKLLNIEELRFLPSLIELLDNIENTEHIRELYRLRKRTAGQDRDSGVNPKEAGRIKNCLRQGRELYISGRTGSLMVKPLNYFYSLTAYAYAVVILNNPIRYSLDALPGSHGINYLPDEIRTQFGGDMPHGTFSELFVSFPVISIRNRHVDLIQDSEASILNFYNTRTTVSCGTLLSMIPEIRDYYSLVTGKSSRTYPLEIATTSDVRNVKWEFQIGDGETRPPIDDVSNSFPGSTPIERHGKIVVEVPIADAHKIRCTIYTDVRGKFWYVQNPFFPTVLPELCAHFLLTNTLSNIMRYSPDSWGDVLLNEVHSDISLITRKYLSAFETKFPILLLRSLSKFYPYVSSET